MILMQFSRHFFVDGRLRWWIVWLVVLGTFALLYVDWYWRTHDTSWLSRMF